MNLHNQLHESLKQVQQLHDQSEIKASLLIDTGSHRDSAFNAGEILADDGEIFTVVAFLPVRIGGNIDENFGEFMCAAHSLDWSALLAVVEDREWKFPIHGDLPPCDGCAQSDAGPDLDFSADCEIVLYGKLFIGYLARTNNAAPYWVIHEDVLIHDLNITAWRYAEDVSTLVIPEVPK